MRGPKRIRIAAAIVTVLAVVGGCASAPVTAESEADVRLELVEWARLAQNAHNVQPWRVELDPEETNSLVVYVDPDRLLPETDPPARQITISVGTFLAVMEARAAQLGYTSEIVLFPEGEYDLDSIGTTPVARVRIKHGEVVAPYPSAAAPDAITHPTVKYRYRPAQLDVRMIERVEEYSTPEIRFSVVTDPEEVAWLNELSIEAFTIEMENEPTLMESYDLTRENGRERRRYPYGISYPASFPRRTLWLVDAWSTLFRQSPEAYARAGIGLFSASMEQINTYIVVVSVDNSRVTQVRTGMALQAVWMDLYDSDHVVLPNSQALQEYAAMADLHKLIHGRYAPGGETVQMLLAVARPDGASYRFSPRRPVEDILR